MNEERNRKIVTIILVALAILVCIYNVVNHFINKNKNDVDSSIVLLEDRNRFFEISSCIDRFIKNVAMKDNDNILKMLSTKYLQEHNIDKNNVLDELPSIDGECSFEAKSIYEQQLSKSVYKYYVKGYYSIDVMDLAPVRSEYYVIVYLYTDNMTFAIEPYDGNLFRE